MSSDYNKPDPELTDVLNTLIKGVFIDLNSHALGTVQAFDAESQTITATINYVKTYMKKNTSTGQYEDDYIEYPTLQDIPVIVLRGGPSGFTLPIRKGDQCLICFNDRSIDNWFAGSTSSPLNDNRMHSLSDGIAIVGLSNASTLIHDYDQDNPCIYNGVSKFKVKENKFLLDNSVETLNGVLQDLVTAIKTLSTTNCVVGAPVVLDPATITNLTNVATRIGGLLE